MTIQDIGFNEFLRRGVAQDQLGQNRRLTESTMGPKEAIDAGDFSQQYIDVKIEPAALTGSTAAGTVDGKVISINGGETYITSVSGTSGGGSSHTHSMSWGQDMSHLHSLASYISLYVNGTAVTTNPADAFLGYLPTATTTTNNSPTGITSITAAGESAHTHSVSSGGATKYLIRYTP